MSKELENKELQDVGGGGSHVWYDGNGNIRITWQNGDTFSDVEPAIAVYVKNDSRRIEEIRNRFNDEDSRRCPPTHPDYHEIVYHAYYKP